jgi:predicted dehydrogenase
MCLKAGKHVLCEKPFAINAAETAEVIRLARESGLFLMEAMWTRYTPAVVKAREWIASGAIGDIKLLKAEFGFKSGSGPDKRLYKPELGGGALLDIGIYTVSLASMIYGKQPSEIKSFVRIGTTGVDEHSSTIFRYEGGKMASLNSSIIMPLGNDAVIYGENGRIHLPMFAYGKRAELYAGRAAAPNGTPEVFSSDADKGHGYHYEASEAVRCIREGSTESSIMPLDETLAIMKTMDAIRSQWGLKYPGE